MQQNMAMNERSTTHGLMDNIKMDRIPTKIK